MSGPVKRVAPGVPAGGQFAPDAKVRSAVTLDEDVAPDSVAMHGASEAQFSDEEHDWQVWGDQEVAANFHRLGFTPRQAAPWHSEGFTPDEAYAWNRTDSGFSAQMAARWRDAGFEPHTASVWDGNGFTYIEAEPLSATMQAHTAAAWRGREGDGWKDWAAQGLGPSEATFYGEMGFAPTEAANWHRSGFASYDAAAWQEKGFAPEQADLMRRNGFFPFEAREWLDNGYPPPPE